MPPAERHAERDARHVRWCEECAERERKKYWPRALRQFPLEILTKLYMTVMRDMFDEILHELCGPCDPEFATMVRRQAGRGFNRHIHITSICMGGRVIER